VPLSVEQVHSKMSVTNLEHYREASKQAKYTV